MEIRIVKFFNRLGLGTLDGVTDFISRVKYLVILWTLLAVGFLLFDPQFGKKIFFGIIIASILHFLITEGIIKHSLTKIWGKRVRPYIQHQEIKAVGRKFTDSSFPSSHMATTLAVLTVILYFHLILWPVALIFGLLMAYARMHQGMHYLSDIIAGIILGMIYGWAGIYLVNNFL